MDSSCLHFQDHFSSCFGGGATVDCLKRADGTWNSELVRQVFLSVDADLILGIPTSRLELNDDILWHYDISGSFSVKSGYRLAKASTLVPSSSGLFSAVSYATCLGKCALRSMETILICVGSCKREFKDNHSI